MASKLYVPSGSGRSFQFGMDTLTIQASADETADGRALIYWVAGSTTGAFNHAHERIEETFYVIDGELEFTLGTDTFSIRTGDFVRVPPKVRHGYVNKSGRPVPMIVTLSPGDLAELFYQYRSGPGDTDILGGLDAYLEDARRLHGTAYEVPGR